jgi:hypothetical protein
MKFQLLIGYLHRVAVFKAAALSRWMREFPHSTRGLLCLLLPCRFSIRFLRHCSCCYGSIGCMFDAIDGLFHRALQASLSLETSSICRKVRYGLYWHSGKKNMVSCIHDIRWKANNRIFISGDIVYIEPLGSPIVVLNTIESVNALFDKRATNYSHRPILTMAGELMGLDRVCFECDSFLFTSDGCYY